MGQALHRAAHLCDLAKVDQLGVGWRELIHLIPSYTMCVKNQARMVPWFRIGWMSVTEVLVTHVEDDLVKVEHCCYW